LILSNKSHIRLNPLTGEWVLVSPHRSKRPWQGRVEGINTEVKIKYDPNCYLCPGNKRAGGVKNPVYKNTFVFENDYSALNILQKKINTNIRDLIITEGESGICRVVCFSPRHDLTLSGMNIAAIRKIVDTWIEEFKDLGKRDDINYVQIFENKGEIMGCSNPHPHSQIWATSSIPVELIKETFHQKDFLQKNSECLLCEYKELETDLKERVIIENKDFIVVVPFWAVWPFETMIISKRHIKDITGFSESEKNSFAGILKKITFIYDRVFNISFPYSAGIHQAPSDNVEHPEWHFHYHFYPPLLRSAVVKKFMVGYEMLANPQKDFTAETAAEVLKNLYEKYQKIGKLG
jgi:UDPglucose--hexose-1-phosphate uridylyltransferase